MFPQPFFLGLGNYFSQPFLKNLFIGIAQMLNTGSATYLICYSLMILFFSYFWVATQFNEIQIADDLKKNGGYIPGVRPGQGTSDYLHKAMSRITLAGAIFLDHHRDDSDHPVAPVEHSLCRGEFLWWHQRFDRRGCLARHHAPD